MRLSDIQPQYFPRLHYFARMLDADVFVVRDDVQFVRNHKYPDGRRDVSYQVHSPVKSPAGTHLLTVSVGKGSPQAIAATAVSYDQPWPKKHARVLKSFYAGAPNLRALMPELEALLETRFPTVAALDLATLCWALGHLLGAPLQIPGELSIERINELLAERERTRLRRIGLGSRELAGTDAPSASERIVDLCRRTGASEYVGGGTAIEAYLDKTAFHRDGIEVAAQSWRCPTYPQQHGARLGHLPNLSILDLLMNVPPREAAAHMGIA